MSESCCNTNTSNKASNQFDHKDAIQERYGSAALEKESCLCTPVGFNPVLLEAIPQEVIERDYGCGDPTKYVQKNDIVLDLGSCLLYTSPSPRDGLLSRMPSSA